jgi:hypothetical protein
MTMGQNIVKFVLDYRQPETDGVLPAAPEPEPEPEYEPEPEPEASL